LPVRLLAVTADDDLLRRIPALLARARALLKLPGGPAGELGKGEVAKAARAVEELHRGLVGERSLAHAATYDSPAHLGAYLLWWWPQTYAKTRATLALVPSLPRRPRTLDLGSGPGPAGLAAFDALGGDVLAADASAAALAEARTLGLSRTEQVDLASALPGGEFELTIAANVLSELPLARRAALVRASSGVVVLIEPALRETGRALLELRDALLADGSFQALAPCLTQKPCPALADQRDWCTADRRWTPPPHVVQLANATGLRADELLSFAPLVLARTAPAPERDVWRVVGVPPPEKGKRRLFVCSDAGRLPVSRLDKHASPANAAFGELWRGDLVRLGAMEERGDGLRVSGETAVEKLPAAAKPR
jgi:hypothetical protein